MEEKLNKLKKFFDYDMKIKRILYECAPDAADGYNSDYSMMYANKLYEAFEDIEFYIISIAENVLSDEYKKYIEAMLSVFKDELDKCGSDFYKLKDFYVKCFSNIRVDFAREVKETCVGYTLFNNGFSLIKKCTTVNELLHVLHSSIVNDEKFYSDVPVIDRKANDIGKNINLLGMNDDISRKIFDIFPQDLSSDEVNIMSFGNKILLMIRDVGHALTIEIDVEGEKCMVRYFVPKVCNYLMINELKGINPVKEGKRYAVGEFQVMTDDTPREVVDFILKVPTDDHIYIPGGIAYQEEDIKKR